jgi:tRNA splicing ligase
MKNKNTTERIKEILDNVSAERDIVKLMLEALVIQAQLEQLQNKHEDN